jgi:hypothetical protein
MNSQRKKAKVNNSNRRQRNNRRRRRPEGRLEGNLALRINPRFPNDIKMKPIHNRAFRFNCGAQTAFTVSPSILLNLMLSGVNGSAVTSQLMQTVRLRRISLYSVPSTNDFGSASSEIVFSWISILNAPSNLITDRGTSTVPACIKVVPPPESQAGFWYSSTSLNVGSNLFQFDCPANTILDIDVDFILQWGTPNTKTLSSGALVGAQVFIPSLSATIIPDGGGFTAVL